jgi:hypothetical protein
MKRGISPTPDRRFLATSGALLMIALGLGSSAHAAPGDAPSVQIRGRVVDDETRQPIPRFVVQYGRPDPKDPSRIVWGGGEARTESPNPEGTFGATLFDQVPWSRVLADGYLPQPITAKPYAGETGTIELVVRLRRGSRIAGRVLDHAGRPVPGAGVFLLGDRIAPNITGGLALRSIYGPEDDTVTRATTDAAGRFALTGAGADDFRKVAVSAPKLDLWIVPAPPEGKELDITLPEPGQLVIRYDIDGAEPEATVSLQLLREGREGWEVAYNVRVPIVPNRGRVVLENLTPGTYDLSRFQKDLRVGDRSLRPSLDRRKVVVGAGQTVEVAFVRESGAAVEGVVVGLKELKLPGAFVYVNRNEEARAGRPDWLVEDRVEALTCDESGRFKTPRLSPGSYRIVAEGYFPEPPERRGFIGWPQADRRAFAVVTVPKDGPAPAVRIEMPKP